MINKQRIKHLQAQVKSHQYLTWCELLRIFKKYKVLEFWQKKQLQDLQVLSHSICRIYNAIEMTSSFTNSHGHPWPQTVWRFPSHHPFRNGIFPNIDDPAMGVPSFMESIVWFPCKPLQFDMENARISRAPALSPAAVALEPERSPRWGPRWSVSCCACTVLIAQGVPKGHLHGQIIGIQRMVLVGLDRVLPYILHIGSLLWAKMFLDHQVEGSRFFLNW